MINDSPWITVGKLVAPQGLDGDIRVNPSSDFPERFTKAGNRWIQKNKEEPSKIRLLRGRQVPGKSIYVVTFEGITNRTSAKSLVGNNLLVPASNRPQLAKGEYHLLDLIGLEAKLNADGPAIGKVIDLTHGGNDLLEIELLEGRKVLIPFVKAIVPDIQLKEGWILLNPPPGLLEL